MEVRLDIAPEGQLTASITAEKPETLDLLQKDIRGLVKALQESGLNTNSNSFNFALRKDQENQLNGGTSKSDLNAELDDDLNLSVVQDEDKLDADLNLSIVQDEDEHQQVR